MQTLSKNSFQLFFFEKCINDLGTDEWFVGGQFISIYGRRQENGYQEYYG